MQMTLNGEWRLAFTMPGETAQRTVSATVPGNVELELERERLLADCMPADDEHATTRFDAVDDWTYTRTFDAPDIADDWSQELVFEGINTVADIYLNGEKLYEARSMFMAHRIDVRGKLRAEGNELKVVIRSALLYARSQKCDVFGTARAATSYGGQTYLRKARHEWGWDNAPRLLTSGLYRPVYLECLPPERFYEVYLYTVAVTEQNVRMGIVWAYQTPDACLLDYTLRCTIESQGQIAFLDETAIDFVRGRMQITVPRDKIALWWPNGFGEPALCDVTLEMLRSGESRAVWKSKWGVRTIRLERSEDVTDDNIGEFGFYVNNERVYINGTNWKPLDALHSRADAKVEKALSLAKDLNCNMVRIWGGGIYEGQAFFDYCDQNGLMVWQDFMFGCEFPPLDDWYCEQVAEETGWIIRQLRNHPSLAVWCGDNEDDSCMSWNLGGSTVFPSDNKINRVVLRECVLRHDPYRSYVPSSPYLSDAAHLGHYPDGSPCHSAEIHLYPATKDFHKELRACKSRFIGETGPIIVNAMTDNPRVFAREQPRAERLWNEPLDAGKRNLRAHQADDYFMSWRQTGKELCALWYGRDFSVDEWQDYSLAVNFICADVFKDVIEYCRTERWNKTGVIWWSLMDMWPMLFNYSVVDCDFCPKLPYYWIRQSQQPFVLAVVRKEVGGEAALYAANDTRKAHAGTYRITAVDASGRESLLAVGNYAEAPNTSRLLQRIAEDGAPALWLIEWEEDAKRFYNHFVTGEQQCGFACWKAWNERLQALYRA